MLPTYAPWFYWNLVGTIRFNLLDVIYDNPGFELIMDSDKTKLFARVRYPIMNPPGAIEDVTRVLAYTGLFDGLSI